MKVTIVDYRPAYEKAFRALNEEWINTYFEMEDSDRRALHHPDEYILQKGGAILVALDDGEPVGVCALIKMDHPDYDYELAKMAVASDARGKNVGYLLGSAVVEKAKALGASRICLKCNSVLKPALGLYRKLGFRDIDSVDTPYKRCNVQMELIV